MGMATLPASTRPPTGNLALREQSIRLVELPERLSFAATVREEVILFTRRRMLDWKAQLTRVAVVASGSALIFLGWKSVISWLS
jgi:hypothetical protein